MFGLNLSPQMKQEQSSGKQLEKSHLPFEKRISSTKPPQNFHTGLPANFQRKAKVISLVEQHSEIEESKEK